MPTKPCLLVIDDDDVTLRLLSAMLKSRGFKVIAAKGSVEGIKATLKEPFDLIILDVFMPVIDGWETLGQLRTQKHTELTPVLMLTSADQLKYADRAFQLGANAYLSKPLDSALFNKKIAELVGNETRS